MEGRERKGPKSLLNQGPSEPCYATDALLLLVGDRNGTWPVKPSPVIPKVSPLRVQAQHGTIYGKMLVEQKLEVVIHYFVMQK